MRRDALNRERLAMDRMIRFVVAPDGQVMPDIGKKLPGRGVWLKPEPGRIELAAKRGVFARAAKRPVLIDSQLGLRVEELLMARMLESISLARRAGQAVIGFDQVAAELREKREGVLVLAQDAGIEAKRLIAMLDKGRYVAAFDREALGGKLGRAQVVYALIGAGALAERIITDARKLAGFRKFEMALDLPQTDGGAANEGMSLTQ